jgi:hypothetical protein
MEVQKDSREVSAVWNSPISLQAVAAVGLVSLIIARAAMAQQGRDMRAALAALRTSA